MKKPEWRIRCVQGTNVISERYINAGAMDINDVRNLLLMLKSTRQSEAEIFEFTLRNPGRASAKLQVKSDSRKRGLFTLRTEGDPYYTANIVGVRVPSAEAGSEDFIAAAPVCRATTSATSTARLHESRAS
jgi:hypothetical protein